MIQVSESTNQRLFAVFLPCSSGVFHTNIRVGRGKRILCFAHNAHTRGFTLPERNLLTHEKYSAGVLNYRKAFLGTSPTEYLRAQFLSLFRLPFSVGGIELSECFVRVIQFWPLNYNRTKRDDIFVRCFLYHISGRIREAWGINLDTVFEQEKLCPSRYKSNWNLSASDKENIWMYTI